MPDKKKAFESLLEQWREKKLSPIEQQRVDLLLYNLALNVHHDASVEKLILESLPLIDRLFKEVKHKGWGSSNKPDKQKARVLAYFENHQSEFPLIRREMLEDDALYESLRHEKQKFDFQVGLSHKIIRFVFNQDYRITGPRGLRKKIQNLS